MKLKENRKEGISELDEVEAMIKQLIKFAGELALNYYFNESKIKVNQKTSPSDIVTNVDLLIQSFLVKEIRKRFPTHGIISEEMAHNEKTTSEYVWVVDPLDGTRNFANHIGFWCIMVGVVKNGEPQIGAVYDPLGGELFFARKGGGSFLNNEKIKTGCVNDMKNSFLVVDCGQDRTGTIYDSREYSRYLKFTSEIMGEDGMWLHNFGSMLSVCHLAAGRIDGVLLNCGLYHDYVAPYVIATEACAVWTNSYAETWKKGQMDIVVANKDLHQSLTRMF